MRMWMVHPRLMCRQHLLGEHGEIHKHRHNFEKQHRMGRRVELEQIEPAAMQDRHDALAAEIVRRGYNHRSPYTQPDISYLDAEHQRRGIINTHAAYLELLDRCPDCRAMT